MLKTQFLTRRFLAYLGLVALVATVGCSTRTTEQIDCTDNAQCRATFGQGSVCASDGFCEEATVHPRCTETYPENLLSDKSIANDHIIIGSVVERGEQIFRSFERAARLAFIQANGRGGIGNLELGLVLCNIDAGLEDNLTSAEALIETGVFLADVVGVPAIIGPAKSGDTEALFLELNDRDEPFNTLLISPSATSDDLTGLDGVNPDDENPGLLWRTAPPDSLQGDAIARDMRSEPPSLGRTVSVSKAIAIFQEGPYGRNLASVFALAFQAQGGELPQTRPFSNETERNDAITAVGQDPTIEEVLFISSDTSDSIAFFDQIAVDTNYDGKTIFVPDAAATSDVLEAANPARFAVTRGSRPAPLKRNEDLVYAAFLAAYETEYAENIEQLSFTANAYDAAWLVGYAAAWAIENEEGVIAGPTMARGLRKVSSGDPLQVGPGDWNLALSSFAEQVSFDVEGSSGDIDYDPATEETTAPTEIWTINGTAIVGGYIIPPAP